MLQTRAYAHTSSLLDCTIRSRPNRFIFRVTLPGDDRQFEAYCPATGNIGNLVFEDMPALLSCHPKRSHNARTAFTVEAISMDPLGTPDPSWVGINQAASNDMIEHFLRADAFHSELGAITSLQREVAYHDCRFDFRLNDSCFLEVKTPLNSLPQHVPHLAYTAHRPLTDMARSSKHLQRFLRVLSEGNGAVVFTVHQYDAAPFAFPADAGRVHEDAASCVRTALLAGVRIFQVNLEFRRECVTLLRHFESTWGINADDSARALPAAGG